MDKPTLDFRAEMWQVIHQDIASIDAGTVGADTESILPVYEQVSEDLSLGTNVEIGIRDRSLEHFNESHSRPSSDLPRSLFQIGRDETFLYTYNLFAGNAYLQIFILVEPEACRPDHYTFSLSMQFGQVERAISAPVTMKLSIDPRALDFVVFAFPPRTSLPTGCLFHLRAWLRSAGVDHRIFGEKDLWFGKDPDFKAIANASFAVPRNETKTTSTYQAIIGRAHVNFTTRWTPVEAGVYALSLEYEAGGAGKMLFENYHLRLYCDPKTVSFLIYSIPVSSNPPGASHRLRFWIRTPHMAPQFHQSYLYQRLWKSDDFKICAHLDFEMASRKFILATRQSDDPPSFDSTMVPLVPNRRRVSRLAPNAGVDDTGESVNDR